MNKFFESLGIVIGTTFLVALAVYLIMLYLVLTWAYVFETTWIWLMPKELISFVPSYWQFAGLYTLSGIWFNRKIQSKSDYLKEDYYEKRNYNYSLIVSFFQPWIFLFVAYLVKVKFYIF